MKCPWNIPGPGAYRRWLDGVNKRRAAEALQRRLQAKDALIPFMQEFVQQDLVASDFLRHLVAAVEQFVKDCEARRSPRLMIFAPPRHGKSHVVSRALPSFLIGRNPRWEIVNASATQDLADEFGLFTRNTLNNPVFQDLFPDCRLDPASNAVSRMTTLARGGYRSLGVGSQIVGRGADVLILDDPIAGQREAYSQTERVALKNWYFGNARTRVAPGGGIIIMHQRWHPEDLAATLLQAADTTEGIRPWTVLSYPAICDDPLTDLLGREKGEALVPERWPLTELEDLRACMPPSMWAALYQQSPYVEQGNFFKADTVRWYDDEVPFDRPMKWMLGADYATSKKATSDHTAIIAGGIDHNRDLYIHPAFVYERLDPSVAVNRTVSYAKSLGTHVLGHEKGVIANLLETPFKLAQQEHKHYLITEAYSRTDAKHVHALTIRGLMEMGKVWFPKSKRSTILPLLLRFTPDADGEDDFIDALATLGIMYDRALTSPPPPPPDAPPETHESAQQQQSRFFHSELERRRNEADAKDPYDW